MDESDGLATVAGELVGEVQNLSLRFRSLKRLAVLLTVVTVVLTAVVADQVRLNRRLQTALSQNYTTSQQQLQTRVDFLCPLYQLLIGLADDPARRLELTPAQKAETDKASESLHRQYAKLSCPPVGTAK